MLKTIQNLNSSLTQHRQASRNFAQDSQEIGTWFYLVVDKHGIRPRSQPIYDNDADKKQSRFKEGMVVEATCRIRSGWTQWLFTEDGWVFDVSPKDKKVRMVEVEVSHGTWQYQVCAESVPVLPRPSLFLASKTAPCYQSRLELEDVIDAKEKVRPKNGRGAFLRLADGRGWVSEIFLGQQAVQLRVTKSGSSSSSSGGDSSGNEGTTTPRSPTSSDRSLSSAQSVLTGSSCSERAGSAREESQLGQWSYVVLDPKGITLRQHATQSQAAKLARRIEEGELVTVVERRMGNGTALLRLANGDGGGWACETAARKGPGKGHLRMMEVDVQWGSWQYSVCADKGIALRSKCSFSDGCKVGRGPQRCELVTATKRVKVGETIFLWLKERGGWIFDSRKGIELVRGPVAVQRVDNVVGSVVPVEGLYLHSSPTDEKWALSKMLLLHDAKVRVDSLICGLESKTWAHVAKGSMEGWVSASELAITLQTGKGEDLATPVAAVYSADQVVAAWQAQNPKAC